MGSSTTQAFSLSDKSGPVPTADDQKSANEKLLAVELPSNILILGETVNGKSTLIRQLGVYTGNKNPDVEIGHGNLSCTKEFGRYPLSTQLCSFYLEDPYSGQPLKKTSYSDLVDFTDEDAIVVANKSDEHGKVFKFELIDTPGLDDSDGNDMEIMAEIISRVSELPHLNAVIYVRSMNKPFGSSFTRFYEYIQRCMPMISNGLIVVHTGYTVDRVDRALSEKIDLAKQRRESFQKATKGKMSLAHFFMDNDPDVSNPFAVSESLNGCYKLLKLLSTQLRLDTSNLKLLKAPNMVNVDAHMLLALQRLQSRLQKRLDDAIAAADKSKSAILRTRREIARLQAQQSECRERLNELDRDAEVVLGTKTVAEDYGMKELLWEGMLWLDKRDVSFDSDCGITKVQKSTGSGCKWLDEDRRGTTWRATLKSGIFRSMEGSATFYTTMQRKHHGEIETLKARLSHGKETIAFHEASLQGSDPIDGKDAEAEMLAEHHDRCTATIERIKKDTFEAALWPLLRQFYVSHHKPSNSDIADFVEVYDPKTSELLVGH
ncbi:hypothetical protein FPCIR_9929 [Fusarium pseudocircinatum]|uniref:G domain-containing protein n=1 Tax=Fusarium pseudocircinatum TaxID=56676 RepID=A0A8H5L0F6_9HYPO|nr:hypothetical protein FPCIR_9929 [Fusarium pseudocircinatum]